MGFYTPQKPQKGETIIKPTQHTPEQKPQRGESIITPTSTHQITKTPKG